MYLLSGRHVQHFFMVYFKHVLCEEFMLALGGNLVKVVHCSWLTANTQMSCFLCFSEAILLGWMQCWFCVMKIVLIKWPGKIAYYKTTRHFPMGAKDKIWLAEQTWYTSSCHGCCMVHLSVCYHDGHPHHCWCYPALFWLKGQLSLTCCVDTNLKRAFFLPPVLWLWHIQKVW